MTGQANQPLSLSRLLPYNTTVYNRNEAIDKKLKEYQTLLVLFQKAVVCLNNGELSRFDGLVGDNACQIPAVKIALLFKKIKGTCGDLQTQIKAVQDKIEALLSNVKKQPFKKEALQAFLDREKLDLVLTEDLAFALHSFILAEIKVEKVGGNKMPSLLQGMKTDHKKLITQGIDVTNQFAAKLANAAREAVSKASLAFVAEEAAALKDNKLVAMTAKTIVHNARECMPMFWSCKTVLLKAQKEGLPILIHAKFLDKEQVGFKVAEEATLLFKSDGMAYTRDDMLPTQPALVVQGVVAPNAAGERLTKGAWTAAMTAHA